MKGARLGGLVAVGVLAFVCAGVWSAVYARAAHGSGELLVAILNVGQGDAIYIESPSGLQVLVDGGPDASVLERLSEVMPALDRSLDAVVATHPDADHIAGLVDVLARFDVGLFIEPGIAKRTATAGALERAAQEEGALRLLARRGMVLDLGSGAYMEVLHPESVEGLPESRANEGAVVMRLVYGESSMLLMADVGKAVEARLMQTEGASLDIEVLKVGHHGSKNSSGAAFVAAASPRVAIISAGEGNRYGHPSSEALGVLERAGALVLRTDKSGTVRCRSSGVSFACD